MVFTHVHVYYSIILVVGVKVNKAKFTGNFLFKWINYVECKRNPILEWNTPHLTTYELSGTVSLKSVELILGTDIHEKLVVIPYLI